MEDTLTIPDIQTRIDELEVALLNCEEECEVDHIFTPGLYSREIGMVAGQIVVSKIHKTEHQYFVLRGSALVMIDNEWVYIKAPFKGITYPGTRRVLVIIEDCSWVCVHATNKKTVEEVEADIIEPNINSVLGTELKKSILSQLKQSAWLGQQ